jgi:hypothetical protein
MQRWRKFYASVSNRTHPGQIWPHRTNRILIISNECVIQKLCEYVAKSLFYFRG